MRWLGIWFDQRLAFTPYVQLACARARKIALHVNALSGCLPGASPALLHQTAQGCALATLFYGSETWFTDRLRKASLDLIQKALNHCARAILPVFGTTPITALLREVATGDCLTTGARVARAGI
jgi:hypothetical protein